MHGTNWMPRFVRKVEVRRLSGDGLLKGGTCHPYRQKTSLSTTSPSPTEKSSAMILSTCAARPRDHRIGF